MSDTQDVSHCLKLAGIHKFQTRRDGPQIDEHRGRENNRSSYGDAPLHQQRPEVAAIVGQSGTPLIRRNVRSFHSRKAFPTTTATAENLRLVAGLGRFAPCDSATSALTAALRSRSPALSPLAQRPS